MAVERHCILPPTIATTPIQLMMMTCPSWVCSDWTMRRSCGREKRLEDARRRIFPACPRSSSSFFGRAGRGSYTCTSRCTSRSISSWTCRNFSSIIRVDDRHATGRRHVVVEGRKRLDARSGLDPRRSGKVSVCKAVAHASSYEDWITWNYRYSFTLGIWSRSLQVRPLLAGQGAGL